MSPATNGLPVDMERINDATGGDEEFLAELVEIFLEDAELRLDEIQGAVNSEDPDELRKTAHKLKGSSANMGANGLMSIAKILEDMGASGVVRDASTHMEGLTAEYARVKIALEQLVSGQAS
ncbi:MAG: Hpt domain-containing protein [Myxococcales bacterium]|nr:Hpt domain-containing protein [Myxococcales bacterium]